MAKQIIPRLVAMILVILMIVSQLLEGFANIDNDGQVIDTFINECNSITDDINQDKDIDKLYEFANKLDTKKAEFSKFSLAQKQNEYAKNALSNAEQALSNLAVTKFLDNYSKTKDRYDNGYYIDKTEYFENELDEYKMILNYILIKDSNDKDIDILLQNLEDMRNSLHKSNTNVTKPIVNSSEVYWGSGMSDVSYTDNTDGIRTWDIGSTNHRYLNQNILINVASADTEVEVQLPYRIHNIARVTDNIDYSPTFNLDASYPGWDIFYNEDTNSNLVTLRRKTGYSDVSMLMVYYTFDVWNIVSDKEFSLDCTVRKSNTTNEYTLKGKIHTSHNLEIQSYESSSENLNDFAGIERSTSFIQSGNEIFSKYFDFMPIVSWPNYKFDKYNDKYIYDIAAFIVKPTGNQPYNIEGKVTAYTSDYYDQSNAYRVLGGYMALTSDENKNKLGIKINVDNTGSFKITNEDMKISKNNDNVQSVISGLSELNDSGQYILYFLIQYPYIPCNNDSDNIRLDASLELNHIGLDSNDSKTATGDTNLYYGRKEVTGMLYWASFYSTRNENKTGLTDIKNDRNAVLDLSADFFCLNEARDREDIGNEYRMEAVIDLSYLTDSKELLETRGSYNIKQYRLSLIDAPGIYSFNSDGTPRVSWQKERFYSPNTSPLESERTSETIEVYGSYGLYDWGGSDSWILLRTIDVEEIWAKDNNRQPQSKWYDIHSDGILRIKVVYNSKFTTALRLEYQMELKQDILDKIENPNDITELKLTHFLDYMGYLGDTNTRDPEFKFRKYPVLDSEEIIYKVRIHDQMSPKPGYSDPGGDGTEYGYTLRNFTKSYLGNATDSAGIILTQALYNSAEKVVGNKDSYWESDTFARKTEVENISEVVYSLSGVATNGSGSNEELRKYIQLEQNKLPYKSLKQRYYVLLPEGLKLNTNLSGRTDNDNIFGHLDNTEQGGSAFLSSFSGLYNENVLNKALYTENGYTQGWLPMTTGNVAGLKLTYNGVAKGMSWSLDGNTRLIDEKTINNRQLLIIDRELTENGITEGKFNLWDWGTNYVTYFIGRGFSFSAVPVEGTGTLPHGEYTAEFWCQFLDDNNTPLSLEEFSVVHEQGSISLLNEALGNSLDENTLIHVASTFKNNSGFAGSTAKLSVKAKNLDEYSNKIELKTGEEYSYKLSYQVTDGETENAVIWCNLEEYERNSIKSEWKGSIKSIDIGSINAKVYVMTKDNGVDFDVNEYISNANKSWLNDLSHGWRLADKNTSWDNVKAIAFSFEGQFNKGDSVEVIINMRAPNDKDIVRTHDNTEDLLYSTYNEFVFSDEHKVQNEWIPARVLKGSTQVTVEVKPNDKNWFIPSTGGYGVTSIYITGASMLVLSVCLMPLLTNKRKMLIWHYKSK